MKTGFLKTRALPAGERSFGDQAKRAQHAARRQSFTPVEGMYDSFYARDKALWFAICPDQKWQTEVYDREEQTVVQIPDSFYMVNVEHRVNANSRRFTCSATAHKTKPCWGCGVRDHFYTKRRETEETTGVKPANESPISAMTQYAIAGVVLETFAKVQKFDKEGRPAMNRDKTKKITNDVPLPLMEPMAQQKAKKDGVTTFGKSVHWNMGITQLNAFISFDEELRNVCRNCCGDLYAEQMSCPECAESFAISEEGAIAGIDLQEMRKAKYQCTACQYTGEMVPLVQCACENPEEGRIVDFALRVKTEKIGDKQSVLKYVEVKRLAEFIEKYPVVEGMLNKPLELDKIYAASNIEFQKTLIPDNMRGDGVSAAPRRAEGAEPMAGAYPLTNSDD